MVSILPSLPSVVRKDWDRWQAGIKFRDPSWSLWSNKFYNSLGITEINKDVPFILIQDKIMGALQGTIVRSPSLVIRMPEQLSNPIDAIQEESSFAIQGSNFPNNAIGINSFFFVQVRDFEPTILSTKLTWAHCRSTMISTSVPASTSSF
jgi:hypothetical protein